MVPDEEYRNPSHGWHTTSHRVEDVHDRLVSSKVRVTRTGDVDEESGDVDLKEQKRYSLSPRTMWSIRLRGGS